MFSMASRKNRSGQQATVFVSELSTVSICWNREIGMRFAELERKLGEIDRARAIYAHLSQICDPRVSTRMCSYDKALLYF